MKKKSSKKFSLKWNLEIDEKHAYIIMEALDVYARVKMGQFERIEDFFNDMNLSSDQYQNIREFLPTLKRIVYPNMPMNGSYGIASPENPESSKIAYEIKKTIEHRVSWDRVGNPSKRDWKTMLGVNFDEPRKHSKHPMPKISTIPILKQKLSKLLEKE